ncbi:hypothetical protein K491DRAFT_74474 [Lophiostoma macrostomum CBS 122681]|uniref:Uncharacterized protein n=1 Tax=Lophiostoma macrostomum CBS 122681 TaxID=1314788 RepID=A0A6A6SWH1_9PLEO|nr:hypothetical protein K491DRAFT_74474 [Lophiostoma macrostomum CBS 122681]
MGDNSSTAGALRGPCRSSQLLEYCSIPSTLLTARLLFGARPLVSRLHHQANAVGRHGAAPARAQALSAVPESRSAKRLESDRTTVLVLRVPSQIPRPKQLSHSALTARLTACQTSSFKHNAGLAPDTIEAGGGRNALFGASYRDRPAAQYPSPHG